jgi:uncharacterized protein
VAQSARETAAPSPFHSGEVAVHARVGVRERLEQIGPRVLREFMPDEHRELFAKLPMLVVGSLDAQRRPWASVIVARPGFIASPDARTLAVSAAPAVGDPLRANLAVGAPIALLGIELATRRRNRANGTVAALRPDGGFEMRVEQSFGNCPQYIHARTPTFVADSSGAAASIAAGTTTDGAARTARDGAAHGEAGGPRTEGRGLSPEAALLVRRADTFFIATAAANARGGDARHGCDVSHRGGNAGFVRVEREQGGSVLYWPDFRGNFFFNTLGNLTVNPRAGLLFMDFESGAALSLTGTASVLWDGPLVAAFAGAERMLRFEMQRGVWLEPGRALRWSAPEPARQLAATGP